MKLINILTEGFELDKAKNDLLQIIDKVMTENEKQQITDLLLKFADEIGDDKEKLSILTNFASTLARKDELTTRAVNKFFKSDYGKRLLSDKALSTDEPRTKRSKDLRIDKVSAFEDITDAHVSHRATTQVLKYVFNFILKQDASIEDKERYIDSLAEPSKLLKADTFLQESNSGNIDSFIDNSITSNPIYQAIKEPLFNLNGKGIGKGEALLIAHSAESGDAPSQKGDITIEGKYFEVKNSESAGSIDSGLSSGKMDIDKHNLSFLSKTIGLSRDEIITMNTRGGKEGGKKTKGIKMVFSHPLVKDKLTVDNLAQYFKPIYSNDKEGLTPEQLSNLSSDVIKAASGGEKDVYAAIAPYVYNLYKSKKGFDALILLKENGDFVSFTDTIPKQVKVVNGMFVRGGNNQSLPVGYINLSF
jgi:hypothetical protein